MSGPDVFALQRSGLNEFLFAAVGEEANGTTLSVASVFARMGRDPWTEAGLLARLPRRDAIGSLARTITSMPANTSTLADATILATRLIALLPLRPRAIAANPSNDSQRAARHLRMAVLLASLGLAVAYGVLATRERPQVDGGNVPAARSADTPVPSHHAPRVGN